MPNLFDQFALDETQSKPFHAADSQGPEECLHSQLKHTDSFSQNTKLTFDQQNITAVELAECDEKIIMNCIKSVLMSIFVEAINGQFIETLPNSIEKVELHINSEIPCSLNLAVPMQYMDSLREIFLHGSYFDYSTIDFIQSLSVLPRCQKIILGNDKLIYQFLVFLRLQSNGSENIQTNVESKENDRANHAVRFKNLNYVKLILISGNTFDVKQITSIQRLQSLLKLEISFCYQRNCPLLRELRTFANSSSLQQISIQYYISIFEMSITIARKYNDGSFDESLFDIKVHLNEEINQLKKKIKRKNILNFMKHVGPAVKMKSSQRHTFSCKRKRNKKLNQKLKYLKYLLAIEYIVDIFNSLQGESHSLIIAKDPSFATIDNSRMSQFINCLETEMFTILQDEKSFESTRNRISLEIFKIKFKSNDVYTKLRREILYELLSKLNEKFVNLFPISSICGNFKLSLRRTDNLYEPVQLTGIKRDIYD